MLTVETVFTDHFINELLRIRVVGEVAAHLHDVMLRLKQEAAGRRARRRLSLGRFLACCYRQQAIRKVEVTLHNDA
ncbi:Uncharacterised protein [Salmonella enterica subsp. enterica]|uniref:Uncharacterized protein n=1 Tax=Salmonella enterica I TaxID=59201 RepID=A0A447TX21_SALET|nr:Uncharacterised protein [Salmonella enterica subsp. enterica]